jgi:polar amino acid transport system substrate-binding protein
LVVTFNKDLRHWLKPKPAALFILLSLISTNAISETDGSASTNPDNHISLSLKHGSLGLEQLSIVKDGEVIGGFKYEFLETVAERLGWNIEHHYCPFQRCLRSMADGSLDVMVFIALNQQRSQYLDFVQIWQIPRKIPFYIIKGQEHRLQRYEDLFQLRVGVVNGYAYFKAFDNDSRIHKSIVLKEHQLPKMLMAGRIDTYIGFNQRQDRLLSRYPQLTIAPFAHGFSDTALLAISKKSPLAKHLKQLEAAALAMIKDGTMDKIWSKYLGDNPMPYPAHLAPDKTPPDSDPLLQPSSTTN